MVISKIKKGLQAAVLGAFMTLSTGCGSMIDNGRVGSTVPESKRESAYSEVNGVVEYDNSKVFDAIGGDYEEMGPEKFEAIRDIVNESWASFFGDNDRLLDKRVAMLNFEELAQHYPGDYNSSQVGGYANLEENLAVIEIDPVGDALETAFHELGHLAYDSDNFTVQGVFPELKSMFCGFALSLETYALDETIGHAAIKDAINLMEYVMKYPEEISMPHRNGAILTLDAITQSGGDLQQAFEYIGEADVTELRSNLNKYLTEDDSETMSNLDALMYDTTSALGPWLEMRYGSTEKADKVVRFMEENWFNEYTSGDIFQPESLEFRAKNEVYGLVWDIDRVEDMVDKWDMTDLFKDYSIETLNNEMTQEEIYDLCFLDRVVQVNGDPDKIFQTDFYDEDIIYRYAGENVTDFVENVSAVYSGAITALEPEFRTDNPEGNIDYIVARADGFDALNTWDLYERLGYEVGLVNVSDNIFRRKELNEAFDMHLQDPANRYIIVHYSNAFEKEFEKQGLDFETDAAQFYEITGRTQLTDVAEYSVEHTMKIIDDMADDI